MIKFTASLGIFALVIGIGLILVDKDKEAYCIEQWLSDTKELFTNAATIFKLSSIQKEDTPNTNEDVLEQEIQALLPKQDLPPSKVNPQQKEPIVDSKPINWHYDIDPTSTPIPASAESNPLLPNLFTPPSEANPRISGQFHLDDADNIIGAEVQLAIPTY